MVLLKGSSPIISKSKIDLIKKQMESSVCKISFGNITGTGFLCLIPYQEHSPIPVIITANHLTNGEIGKKIEISFNNEQFHRVINFDESRLIYTNKENDITIIGIKKEDDLTLNQFFELDKSVFSGNIYNDEDIYLISYAWENYLFFSTGKIINKLGKLLHTCNTQPGSSGAPIINLKTFKIIGIHIGSLRKKNKYNLGYTIKKAVEEFIKKFNDSKIFNNTMEENYFEFFINNSIKSLNNSKDTYKMKFDISDSSKKLMELNLSQIEPLEQPDGSLASLNGNNFNCNILENIEKEYDSLFSSGTIKIKIMKDTNKENDNKNNINYLNNFKKDNYNEFGPCSFSNKMNLE